MSCRESGISLASGFLGCKGSPTSLSLERIGGERRTEEREAFCEFLLCLCLLLLLLPTMPNTRSMSPSPSPSPAPAQSNKTNSKKKGKTQSKKTTADKPRGDAEDHDERPPSPETDDSSSDSAGFVDKRLDSLMDQQADLDRQRAELDAAAAKIRSEAEHLMAYPSRTVPRSLPTPASGSVSSGSVALSGAAPARKDPGDDARSRRQDDRTADAARAARMRRLRTMFGSSHDALRSSRSRDELGVHDARDRGTKRVRFAAHNNDSDDDDDEDLVLAAPEAVPTRMSYITRTVKLLLFLSQSTLSPSSTMLPSSLSPTLTLVYSAALTDIRQRLHTFLGARQPTFADFLFIMHAAQQYAPSLFPKREHGALAVAALAAWHTQFTNELTDVMKLANGSQEFVDGLFPLYLLKLRDAEASTFDPVAVVKALFADVTVKLVSKRQKEVMTLALSYGQSLQQHQSGGKGSGVKGWGKGGKGKGGKGGSYPSPPGMPGQDWSDHFGMYIRFAYDSAGQRIRKACFKCGCGSTPNSTSSHHARDCKADGTVVQDWVRFMKPAP